MSNNFVDSAYSGRARLLAIFVMLALVLGGGGTPNPTTEIVLELLFAAFATAWVWLRQNGAGETRIDRLAYWLMAAALVIPLVQLVPLPPSVWHALPGRGDEIAALSLIGEQSTWRPISLSPSRTLASLLAIVPAVFCLYAVSRMDLNERRLLLVIIVVAAVISSWLGAVQLTAGGGGVNLYPEHSLGFVTGFQANRNAEADVLLIGLLALAVVAAPYLAGERRRLPLGLTRRAFALFVGGIALLLLAATVMTGSRAGVALVVIPCIGSVPVFSLARSGEREGFSRMTIILLVLVLLIGCAAAFVALSQNTAIARVAARFSDLGDERAEIWQDSWFTLKQYWPTGFGMGGFEPAMIPAESLEYLDPRVPNRAHNDFLEIGIEAGIFGYVMVAGAAIACIGVAWRSWRDSPRSRDQVMFGLSVLLLIALHSVVDYPLRSMAVACLSGVAGGLLVRTRTSTHRSGEFERAAEIIRGMA